jgi:hypothetical protein
MSVFFDSVVFAVAVVIVMVDGANVCRRTAAMGVSAMITCAGGIDAVVRMYRPDSGVVAIVTDEHDDDKVV